MKQFQVFRYLKKYWAAIAVASVTMGVLFWLFTHFFIQTYTATVVIEYTNPEAAMGYAPDGTELDTSEIYAANIMTKVIENLRIDPRKINADRLRAGVLIQPVITTEEQKVFEAKVGLGEDYELHPTKYMVSFSATAMEASLQGKEYPRKVLNEMMGEYFTYFGKTHVNSPSGANGVADIYDKGYDYIEMMEVIDDSLLLTMDHISKKISMNDEFRANDTGYAFTDLYREFALIQNIEVPRITADILYRQITKDRDLLLTKYNNRNNDIEIANTVTVDQVEKITQIINSYVEMMSNSKNTDVTPEYILRDVYEVIEEKASGQVKGHDQTTIYDRLLMEYVAERTGYEDNVIDHGYNQYVMNIFRKAEKRSADAVLKGTEERIYQVVQKMNGLYEILAVTNDEYNKYLGAATISLVASAAVSERIPTVLFTVFILVIFGVIGCVGAVLIGRAGDMVEYYMYTNTTEDLPNHARCEKYLSTCEKKLLPLEFVCMVIQLKNEFAQIKGNVLVPDSFSQTLKEVFGVSQKNFLSYDGDGRYVLFLEDTSKEQAEAAAEQFQILVEEKCEDMELGMSIGIASAREENCYYARRLLTKAILRTFTPRDVQQQETYAEELSENINENTEKSYFETEDYFEKFQRSRKE